MLKKYNEYTIPFMKIKNTPFIEKNRSKRKLSFIRMKNKIRKHSLKKGVPAIFLSYDVLNEGTQWADIYFLSKKHANLFYNATIETTIYSWHDALETKAFDMSWDKYTHTKEWLLEIDKTKQALIAEKSVFIRDGFKLIPKYSYGQGLLMKINTSAITYETIVNAINEFLENGEEDKAGTEDLSYEFTNMTAMACCNQLDI